jgi:uncharacterized protein YrrD
MRKGKTVIGKDVLSLADGRRIHSVKDLIIGANNAEVIALLVDEGGLLSGSLVVPIENVHSIGRDAVVITESASVLAASKYPRVNEIIDRKERLIGKKVFTESGEEHGKLSDVYFDETSGRILGFEVTGGIFNNVTRGNSYLPIEDIIRVGPDLVYVQPEAVAVMESQVGGVQGALQGAGDRLGGAAASARERLGEAGSTAQQRLGEAGTTVQQRVGETRAEAERRMSEARDSAKQRAEGTRPEESLVGRRAGRDVEDDQGNIIVAANQRITQGHVDAARDAGKTRDLVTAAAATQLQDVGEGVSAAAGQAGDKAASLWDGFTQKIGEMTDATGKRVDEERTKKRLSDIEEAVGRPVTKVILDREDNVILNLGDIITHEAVQRAYDAGGLDSLLASVYKGEVTFEKEEMKVRGQAAATAITIERASGEAPFLDELQQKVDRAQQERDRQRETTKTQSVQEREQRDREREERARQRDQEAEERKARAEEDKAAVVATRSRSSTNGSKEGPSS